jgi:hypothetical protein
MKVDGCKEIGTELENFENIPFRGWIWRLTSVDSPRHQLRSSVGTTLRKTVTLRIRRSTGKKSDALPTAHQPCI